MFESQYYCLVAGLKEYTLDSDTKGFDAKAIVEDIISELSKKDAASVRLLYSYYDCENLAARRMGRMGHNPLGNLSSEQIEEQLQEPDMLPKRVAKVVRAYANPEGEDAEDVAVANRFERELFGAYYAECAASSNRFMRAWGETDRTLRNVSAAIVARSISKPIEEVLVGGGDIVEQLARSSAADFGLRGELPYLDAVIAAVNDEPNIVEKERKVDMVRWAEAEELSSFDYFNVNAVMSYLVRVNIVARWMMLDPKRGREMFEKLLSELSAKDMINK